MIYPVYNDTSIFVSDVSIVPSNEGRSKFRSFNIKKYDLTSIFLQYTPIQYANYYIYELNAHINDVSKDIHEVLQTYTSYDNATYKGKSYIKIDNINTTIYDNIHNKNLIPGCIYELYYNDSSVIHSIIAIADSSSSFSNKAIGIIRHFDHNTDGPNFFMNSYQCNLFDVRFEIIDSEENKKQVVHITYMKDHYNNEAYFDFLNTNYIIRPADYKSGKKIINNKFLSTCNNIYLNTGTFINN